MVKIDQHEDKCEVQYEINNDVESFENSSRMDRCKGREDEVWVWVWEQGKGREGGGLGQDSECNGYWGVG